MRMEVVCGFALDRDNCNLFQQLLVVKCCFWVSHEEKGSVEGKTPRSQGQSQGHGHETIGDCFFWGGAADGTGVGGGLGDVGSQKILELPAECSPH
ncbi:hypothetical protein LY76DRAFT_14617 [Colletotrichum caudatum]|nr:hypothetical protein LY76DRAFT_14617 [Colletotrichum caudatum]